MPLIAPGVEGIVFTVTLNVCAAELPQVFAAITKTLPLVALAVVVITLVIEIPVQPPGKVQV